MDIFVNSRGFKQDYCWLSEPFHSADTVLFDSWLSQELSVPSLFLYRETE